MECPFSAPCIVEPRDKLDTARDSAMGAPSQSNEFAGSYTNNADSTVSIIPVQLNKHFERVAEYDEADAATDLDTGLTFGYLPSRIVLRRPAR